MDGSTIISNFCKTLASFCKHIQNSSVALKESLERRPIPLDSAASTFIQCLNRRVSCASSDLNLLESMTCGTVSFEELLGHCDQLYKKNQTDFLELEDHFKNFGYIHIDDEDDILSLRTPIGMDAADEWDLYSLSRAPVSVAVGSNKSITRRLEDDPLFDESLSLQSLGLSDVCLATIASEANDDIDIITPSKKPLNEGELLTTEVPCPPTTKVLDMTQGDMLHEFETVAATKTMINIARCDYENLPSFMKSLASWEDMVVAVDKMNSTLNSQDKSKACNLFYQDELTSLGLGPKVRSYLLMLLRMNRLVVETVNGSIAYRVL